MGFEDLINLMLRSGTNYLEPTIGASVGQILPENDKRIAVILSPPSTGSVFFKPQNSATLNGFRLGTSSNPIVLSLLLHGHIVQDAWSAVHSVGGVAVAVAEVVKMG